MGHPSVVTCIFMALALPSLICGRPATTDDSGSFLNTLESRASKPAENFSEPKAISSLISQEDLPILTKSRQRRLSDQRRAELETLVTLSKINGKRSLNITRSYGYLDPVRIGRRRRFAVDQAATELVPIKEKHIGDPAYPLIS